jgi:hypothetical protein
MPNKQKDAEINVRSLKQHNRTQLRIAFSIYPYSIPIVRHDLAYSMPYAKIVLYEISTRWIVDLIIFQLDPQFKLEISKYNMLKHTLNRIFILARMTPNRGSK